MELSSAPSSATRAPKPRAPKAQAPKSDSQRTKKAPEKRESEDSRRTEKPKSTAQPLPTAIRALQANVADRIAQGQAAAQISTFTQGITRPTLNLVA